MPTSMHVLTHLHQTSVHICYGNIQPSVLSVALATDQRSSNGCYNCTGQAGSYQPAVKMVTDICSMQIPYSGCFCVDTLHSISIFFVNFIHPSIQLTFFAYWFRKGLYFDQTLCHKVLSDIVRSVYPITSCFSQSRNFYENKLI